MRTSIPARRFLALALLLVVGPSCVQKQSTSPSERGLTLEEPAAPAVSKRGPRDVSVPNVVVQSGHRAIATLAMHPSGRWLASAGVDRVIKIWDLATRRELRTLSGHTDRVHDVVISPDGKMLASVAADHTLRLWDFATGKLVRTIAIVGTRSMVPLSGQAVAFADAGRSVVAVADAPFFYAWNVATGEREASVELAEHGVSLAVSRDGTRAVIGTARGDLQLLALPGWAARPPMLVHRSGYVDSVALDAAGKIAVSAGRDGRTVVSDVTEGRVLRELERSADPVDALALDAPNDRVYGIDRRGSLLAWRLSTGKIATSLKPEWPDVLTGITRVALATDASMLYLGTSRGDLATWTLDARLPERFERITGYGLRAAIDPQGRTLLIADGTLLRRHDLATGKLGNVTDAGTVLADVAFTPDGKRFLALTTSGVAVVDVAGARVERVLQTAMDSMMALSGDGKHVATAGMAQAARVFNAETGAPEGTVNLGAPASCLALSRDGATVLSGGLQMIGSSLQLRRVQDGKTLREFKNVAVDVPPTEGLPGSVSLRLEDSYFACALAAHGTRVLAATADGNVRVFDAASGRLLATLAAPAPVLAFASTDDGHVLTAGMDNDVSLWELQTHKLARRFQGHTAAVTQLVIEPGGKRFVSVSDDHTLRFWSMDDEQATLVLAPVTGENPHGGAKTIGAIVADPDGYFDFTSRRALDFVHAVRGDDVVPLRQFIDVFYRPGLFAAVRGGKPLAKTVDLATAFRMPPELRLEARLSGDSIDATVGLSIKEGGIAKVALYRNGRLLAERAVDSAPARQRLSFAIKALPGPNELRAVASSQDAIRSYSNVVSVRASGSNGSERVMYVVSIGVDDYGAGKATISRGGKDALLDAGAKARFGDLAFAVADARAFADAYGGAVPAEFARTETVRIFDRDATKQRILDTLAEVARKADDNDAIVVFFAGHGIALPHQLGRVKTEAYYFVPASYGSLGELERTGVSSDDLMRALGQATAQDVVLLLDTCQSGASNEAFANGVVGALGALGEDSGIQMMASATSSQAAQELRRLKHGVFTYALLEALSCKGGEPLSFATLAQKVQERIGTLLGNPGEQSAVVLPGNRDPVVARCR
jgi:WD40 repeat protein